MAEDTISKDGKIRRGELHRFVWRWHFYAGLVTAPFLIILTLTGALYLFNHEIENWWYRNLVEVPQYAQMAPASVQEALVLHAYPAARIRSYALPLDNHHAAEWTVSVPGGKPLVVFVNPARPAITGAISADTRLMQVIRNLHARLLLGEPGRYVMELAACWGFVLLVTGLFLWWPRRVRMEGVVAPRLRARGRIFW